jgi:hypothetical protein
MLPMIICLLSLHNAAKKRLSLEGLTFTNSQSWNAFNFYWTLKPITEYAATKTYPLSPAKMTAF